MGTRFYISKFTSLYCICDSILLLDPRKPNATDRRASLLNINEQSQCESRISQFLLYSIQYYISYILQCLCILLQIASIYFSVFLSLFLAPTHKQILPNKRIGTCIHNSEIVSHESTIKDELMFVHVFTMYF
jgi:hypothetical protein